MIVSHSRRFIYVKASKVAGTSIEAALVTGCNSEDVVTRVDLDPVTGLGQHATPAEVRKFVGEKAWAAYRKIVTVRNPWDMLVSHYFFAHQRQAAFCPAFFDKFVWWNLKGGQPLNKAYWLAGGKRWADVYLRFESLEEDCGRLFGELGVPFGGLAKIGSGIRPAVHYSAMYNRETEELVARTYADEVREFGYEFRHWYQRVQDGLDNTLWRK